MVHHDQSFLKGAQICYKSSKFSIFWPQILPMGFDLVIPHNCTLPQCERWGAEGNSTHLISCSSLSVAILNLLSSSRVRSSSAWLLTALSRSRLSSSHWRRILSRSCTILSRSLNAQSRRFILIVASFFASDEEKKKQKKCSMRGYCIWWCKPTCHYCVWFFTYMNKLINLTSMTNKQLNKHMCCNSGIPEAKTGCIYI